MGKGWKLGILVFLLGGSLTACVTTPQLSPKGEPISQIFLGDYEQIWRASQKALARYPIRVNNSDTGLLQTDYIRGSKAYSPPFDRKTFSSGYRHQISLRLAKGSAQGRSAVKVSVTKAPELQRDFFSTATSLESDGVEELVILYRIQRELDLEKALD